MRPNDQTVLRVIAAALGSASVSLVGDGVSPARTFLEDCFGETPKPTSETLALPKAA